MESGMQKTAAFDYVGALIDAADLVMMKGKVDPFLAPRAVYDAWVAAHPMSFRQLFVHAFIRHVPSPKEQTEWYAEFLRRLHARIPAQQKAS